MVYAKEPFGGPEQVLKYLTGYTHRVALTNRRLVKLEDGRVTFTWKDYADGCRRKEMTLEAVEFVRRFALHIIPKGLVRIRRYGLLAHRDRGERLALCRSLLGAGRTATASRSSGAADCLERIDRQQPVAQRDRTSAVVGRDPSRDRRLRMGICILAVLVSLVVASGEMASLAWWLSVPPVAVRVEDRCTACGVGRLQTTWHAVRPGRVERQRIRILDSS